MIPLKQSMKRFFALITILTIVSMQAQWKVNFDKADRNNLEDQKRISYGYFLGVNYFDFKIHPSEEYTGGLLSVEPRKSLGFSAGLMGKLKINNNFDLRLQPGVHFTERKLIFNHINKGHRYNIPVDPYYYEAVENDSIREIKSSYIDMPLLLEFHGNRWFNTRPYIMAGVGYAINLQSEEGSDDDNMDGVFRLKTHSFNWQVEGGINIYFNKFKLTPSIKGIFFFNNELVADDYGSPNIWAGSIKSLHTRAVMFSLKFE